MLATFFWAEQATNAKEGGGHHVVWIAEQVNHILGPVVFPIQKAIMQSINPNWQGDPHNAIPEHITLVIISVLICTLGLYLFRGKLSVDNPSNRQQILEGAILQIRDLLDQIVGAYGRRYLAVIASFAIFILVSNLMGVIPGLKAATVNPNVTWALGLFSFVYYISRGFKQQGFGYLKHFMGGPELMKGFLILFGVIIFVVEIISNLFRPFTLGLRLFVNIYADEQIAEIVGGLVPVLVPAFLLVLAVFVSFVQTFIFVVLSCVYLSETVPHDDHHDDHHDEHEGAHASAH
ncbi:MAG: F0F1 ATP synthase subunit A [Blastocatellia bacterium]|nr:F0F1 ATP synthase subunit A [Blastocatellia bacterium]MBN8724064.1 F0F1 ATP synthase subunit A [Acidobacteriota bacterium]